MHVGAVMTFRVRIAVLFVALAVVGLFTTAQLNQPFSGSCGGDLTGTYPACAIGVGAVTATKIGSGAAATNIGSLSGDLTGTLPTPTVPGMLRRLGRITGANFNTTADQPITIVSTVTKYLITAIYVTNCSANLTTAAGGFYPTTAKGGTAIVANTQIYTSLTASTILLPTTLAAGTLVTALTAGTIYLSLTLGQGGAATCDVYVFGADLT